MRSCGDRTLSQPPHLCVCAKGKAKTKIGPPPSEALPRGTLVGIFRCEVESRYLAIFGAFVSGIGLGAQIPDSQNKNLRALQYLLHSYHLVLPCELKSSIISPEQSTSFHGCLTRLEVAATVVHIRPVTQVGSITGVLFVEQKTWVP